MSKDKRSRRHHYLPRYYLKGFTDSSGCFYVYDKVNDRILPKPISPSSAFFENNLNTVILPDGKRSDFMEEIYAKVESKTWESLDNIRRSTAEQAVDLWDKMHLFHFLLYLHWRLPSNFHHADDLSKTLFSANSRLPFVRIVDDSGRGAPKEMLAGLRDLPGIKNTARLMAAFAPFYEENWVDQLRSWRFLYSGDSLNWFLVGDNPIVARGDYDNDPKRCLKEFIFPVSGNILVVASEHGVRHKLAPEFAIQYNTAILMRSSRFAACHREDFLEAIVRDYKLHLKFGAENTIIDSLFAMLSKSTRVT